MRSLLISAIALLLASACSSSSESAAPVGGPPDADTDTAALPDSGPDALPDATADGSADAQDEEAPNDASDGDESDAPAQDAELPDTQGDQEAEAGGPAPIDVELPPGFSWCTPQDCGTQQAVVRVCATPGCQASKSATVEWTINGRSFDRLALLVMPLSGSCTTSWESGPGWLYWQFAMATGASSAKVETDSCDLEVTHYHLALPWNGTLHLPFEATGLEDAAGRSWFFRYEGYDPQVVPAGLHAKLSAIATGQSAALAVDSVAFSAWLLPTELAVALGAEGNLSMGGGRVSINYGNPDWIAAMGGAEGTILHEFSHEYTHELFLPVSPAFQGNNACLNEGLADAVGNALGHIPDSDFCPDTGAGCEYAAGCTGITEIHAAGNCVLWNVKSAGLLGPSTIASLLHPNHTYAFDTCDFGSEQTGNSYVVLFTEASGQDASAAVTAMGMAHAGSYAAAKAALGW